jgi:cell wall-associated NlpC family hydrolase
MSPSARRPGNPLMLRLRLLIFLCVFAVLLALPAMARAALRKQQAQVAEGVKIARYARKFVGIRYSYGGTSPRTGFDCSGFVRFVYAHFGLSLPHYTVSQFRLGRRVSRAALHPGDLVFFNGLSHVGLYIGRGLFVHAPHTGLRVQVESINGWSAHEYAGARRVVRSRWS